MCRALVAVATTEQPTLQFELKLFIYRLVRFHFVFQKHDRNHLNVVVGRDSVVLVEDFAKAELDVCLGLDAFDGKNALMCMNDR